MTRPDHCGCDESIALRRSLAEAAADLETKCMQAHDAGMVLERAAVVRWLSDMDTMLDEALDYCEAKRMADKIAKGAHIAPAAPGEGER